MLIKVICQAKNVVNGYRTRAQKALLLLVILDLASGCLHVYRHPALEPWPQVHPPVPRLGPADWISSFIGLGLVLMLWLGRRRAERGGLVLDRKELALVRTARDALRLLVRRRRVNRPQGE